jgi:hypothetical protein
MTKKEMTKMIRVVTEKAQLLEGRQDNGDWRYPDARCILMNFGPATWLVRDETVLDVLVSAVRTALLFTEDK